jgi:hypothetical protein
MFKIVNMTCKDGFSQYHAMQIPTNTINHFSKTFLIIKVTLHLYLVIFILLILRTLQIEIVLQHLNLCGLISLYKYILKFKKLKSRAKIFNNHNLNSQ